VVPWRAQHEEPVCAGPVPLVPEQGVLAAGLPLWVEMIFRQQRQQVGDDAGAARLGRVDQRESVVGM